MSALTDRIAELGQAILLACMDRSELLYAAKRRIKAEDFKGKVEQNVWKKMIKLEREGQRYDVDAICNPNYVDEIDASSVAKWNPRDDFVECDIGFFTDRCDDFVNMVDREQIANKCYKLATNVMDGVVQNSQQAGELLNALSTESYKMHPVHSEKNVGELLDDAILELQNINKYGEDFGIKSINEKLGKLSPGQVILIAARPSLGKSAIVLSAVENFCKKGKTAVINTLEMAQAEVIARLIARESNVTMNKIIGKELTKEIEWQSLAEARKIIADWKLRVREDGLRTISEIDSYLTMRAANHDKVDLFVIDHFGLLSPEGKVTGNRASDYKKISNDLKQLAKKHKCVMIILAQLNRGVGMTDRPEMGNLADTSALEQDADKVLALYRDASDTRMVNVAVLKNRQGEYFETRLVFYPSTMRFYDEHPM